jgi:hypothetical protein
VNLSIFRFPIEVVTLQKDEGGVLEPSDFRFWSADFGLRAQDIAGRNEYSPKSDPPPQGEIFDGPGLFVDGQR